MTSKPSETAKVTDRLNDFIDAMEFNRNTGEASFFMTRAEAEFLFKAIKAGASSPSERGAGVALNARGAQAEPPATASREGSNGSQPFKPEVSTTAPLLASSDDPDPLQCERCGKRRTIHPNGNFYECHPCHLELLKQSREAAENVAGYKAEMRSHRETFALLTAARKERDTALSASASRAGEQLEKRIREIAVKHAAEYPNVATCPPYEALWAIESTIEGTDAANRDMHVFARKAWEAGFALRGTYSDNYTHFKGEQKEAHWKLLCAEHGGPGVQAQEQTREQLAAGKAEWLVWSIEHHQWWKPNRRGYTSDRDLAGRYTLAEAVEICENANGHTIDPNETIVKA